MEGGRQVVGGQCGEGWWGWRLVKDQTGWCTTTGESGGLGGERAVDGVLAAITRHACSRSIE